MSLDCMRAKTLPADKLSTLSYRHGVGLRIHGHQNFERKKPLAQTPPALATIKVEAP